MVKLGLLCFLGFCFSYSRAGCPQGEVYSNCAQPISCVTCENPQPCPTFTCSPGCNCPDGQLRGPGSECIPRDQCPSKREQCKTNEVYKDCGSYCTPTCATWEIRHEIFCPAVCVEGCFCIDGLIKNDDGVCVSPANCSSQKGMSKRSILCKADEIYMECGSACPATCANRNQPREPCIAVCRRGCFCIPGLLRNSDGKCVAPSQCQPPAEACKADEQYYDCPNSCKNNCENYKNPGIRCGCDPPGCFCKEGLVKRKDDACVKYEDCNLS